MSLYQLQTLTAPRHMKRILPIHNVNMSQFSQGGTEKEHEESLTKVRFKT